MRFIPVTLLMLGSSLATPVFAAEAQDWLQRYSNAERSQSFQGTFVYARSGRFTTNSISRQVEPNGGLRERLRQLDGYPQEVLRVNGRLQCVSGAPASMLGGDSANPVKALNAAQLAQWYDVQVTGESRVADRAAVVVSLRPRDQYRYGMEIHLDRDTALPLKSLLLDGKGNLLERLQYTSLQTGNLQATNLLPGADCHPLQITAQDNPKAEQWHSDWLPPGFVLSSSAQRRSPVSTNTVDWLLFEDGLARFSVFLEPLHGAAVADVRIQQGPTAAISRRLTTADGDVMVTVVGEVPPGTAERVALSMRTVGREPSGP